MAMEKLFITAACIVLCVTLVHTKRKQPHIIVIMADDLGWNDVGFHGSEQIPTPNIDKYASEGVTLNNYYILPMCTPSRASLMTGKYPIHTGMQSGVIEHESTWGLGIEETTMPQYLKKQGYTTRAVGKWHLGMYAKELTPAYRGFDSFYGFYLGMGDFWNHSSIGPESQHWGLDLHRDTHGKKGVKSKDIFSESGNYATELFTAEAENVISEHDTSKPLFMYLAHQAVHVGEEFDPLQAPKEWIEKYSYIEHEGRRKYAAMMGYLDYSVGRIFAALEKKGILDDSVVLFTADNGGAPNEYHDNWASNHPLRGAKGTLFQGGVRGTGFVYSKRINKEQRGTISNQMIHMTDWLPTFVSLAGGKLSPDLDGFDVWNTLKKGKQSPRKEVLLNIDSEAFYHRGLVSGDWKLIKDGFAAVKYGSWYPPPGLTPEQEEKLSVKCGAEIPKKVGKWCVLSYCLFNLAKDPCEINDVAKENPEVYDDLKATLDAYEKTAVKPRFNRTVDPRSDPALNGGIWKPWVTL